MHLCCCRLLFKVGRSKASEGQDCTGSDSLLVQAYLSPWMCTCIQINGNFAIKFHILSGTTQRVTSAYHPHANGLVECQNRTIQRSTLKVLQGEQQRWPDALLGFYCFSHSMTQINWSDTIENDAFPQSDTDAEVITTDKSPVDEKELQEQLSSILNMQSVIHQEGAAKSIDKAQRRQKKDYERRHHIKSQNLVLVKKFCYKT